jgi:hypothetical protein
MGPRKEPAPWWRKEGMGIRTISDESRICIGAMMGPIWEAPMANDERPPEITPWGEKYEESEPIPGFTFVHTGRHGGLYLTPDQRKDIPDVIRPHSSDEAGIWWEEDSAWSLPVVCLLSQRPSLSDEEKDFLEQAHEVARGWFPDEWEQITGREIKAGESYQREEGREIALIHADDLLAGAIWRPSPKIPGFRSAWPALPPMQARRFWTRTWTRRERMRRVIS